MSRIVKRGSNVNFTSVKPLEEELQNTGISLHGKRLTRRRESFSELSIEESVVVRRIEAKQCFVDAADFRGLLLFRFQFDYLVVLGQKSTAQFVSITNYWRFAEGSSHGCYLFPHIALPFFLDLGGVGELS